MKNRGLSLIEVLTAVAILGMVVVAVSGFMTTGINTSSRANVEASLQKEAQTGLNQVTDWVMSANHGIAVYGPCGYYDKAVGIYHDGESSADKYVQVLYYRQADNTVYYDKLDITPTFQGTQIQIQNQASSIEASSSWKNHLFCEYVKNFDMDISHLADQYVELTLVLELKGMQYNKDPKRITLRNKAVLDPTNY